LARLQDAAKKGAERITYVVAEPECMAGEQAEAIFRIARKQEPFDQLSVPVRFVFCLREDLDTLYDSGRIDENLYLFMGTTELKVPSLEEVSEDIPVMDQALLDQNEEQVWRLDAQSGVFLRDQEWPGDVLQLAKVLHQAISGAAGHVLSASEIEDAF